MRSMFWHAQVFDTISQVIVADRLGHGTLALGAKARHISWEISTIKYIYSFNNMLFASIRKYLML